MFIEDVVYKIWEPITTEYEVLYQKAMKLTDEELFQKIITNLKDIDNFILNTRELNMTRLLTTGCPHNCKNGKFGGCSMCDYLSYHLDMLTLVCALRDRNPELYAKAMRFSFDNVRGKNAKAGAVELITGHDCLNTSEIPEEAFQELFGKDDLFRRKPFKAIFETRLDSITYKGLKKWEEKMGKKVLVEVGIEVWDEWVRNHWINKNITQSKMLEGIDIIKKAGCEVSANILIGIPGLTEDTSVKLFIETYLKLYEIGVDFILCSPLSRKEKTLQGYIYQNMRENERLKALSLVNGEETGMPSIFTVMDAIHQVLEIKPESIHHMTLSPANFPVYASILGDIYKENEPMKECVSQIMKSIQKLSMDKDIESFAEARKTVTKTECYQEYLIFKKKQNEIGDVYQEYLVLGEELAKNLWPLEWKRKIEDFKHEMDSYIVC